MSLIDPTADVLAALREREAELEAREAERRRTREELRQSEADYRTLFENAQVGIYRTTPDGRILRANPALLRILGYSSLSELTARDLEHQGFGPTYARDRFKRRLEEHGSVVGLEADWLDRDGRLIHVRENAQLVRDADGQPLFYEGTVEDITERKQLEQELAKIDKLESIGLLAAGIAHDFNNVLTSLLGNITLSRLELDPRSEAATRLEAAEQAIDTARSLTHQLSTFARGGEPVRAVTELTRLVKEAATFALRGSNVRCSFSLSPDLWPAEVDGGQVARVVGNLVINADQAMPLGGELRVAATNVEVDPGDPLPLAPGRYVALSVADDGPGIPDENLRRVFDPFFSTKESGTGLGLTASHSIVRAHGGLIRVESRPGWGATFHVYLPASSEGPPPSGDEASIPPGEGGRILVMDDDATVREMLAAVLRRLGYEAEFAAEGREALALYGAALADGRPFDLVLLDLTIPGGMGGKEAIGELLRLDPHVRAVVSSGYCDDPVLARYPEHGFAAVLPKPYGTKELQRLLATVPPRDHVER